MFPLSHRMGEGRGEGKSAEQQERTVEFTHGALTLNPSPVRREREMRIPPKCPFSSLAALRTVLNAVALLWRTFEIVPKITFEN
jgi:hypothetical protein